MEKRNKNKINKKLRMLGINSAGIKCKLESFSDVLKRLQPQIWSTK